MPKQATASMPKLFCNFMIFAAKRRCEGAQMVRGNVFPKQRR